MKKTATISNTIRRGNLLILVGGLFIIVFFTAAMIFIGACQRSEVRYNAHIPRVTGAIVEANKLYFELDDLIYSGLENPSHDMETPEFDALVAGAANDLDATHSLIESAQNLYDDFKKEAGTALELGLTDVDAAYEHLDEVAHPIFLAMNDKLNEVGAKYVDLSEKAAKIVTITIESSTIMGFILFAAMLVYSLVISKKMAESIAVPVVAVAEWAETLSTGADKIEAMHTSPDIHIEEIQRMIRSFTIMSDSIKENVNVVRKVADGDMTAYVNIRSSEDSLGKSLYKMVQSNDIMFAQIAQIADSVTEGTDSIAEAAKHLADNCTEQATAISDFQMHVRATNELVKENAEAAAHASSLSDAIRSEVVVSKEKMQELVIAMKAINTASQKISGVIANIESLANQTNLLAINATIEAKRAGAAGKSFAVVASSIKDLADNSKASAEQTKKLVDDTISKAKRGSQISDETHSAFETIMDSLEQIIDVSGKIADSGIKQQENMNDIERRIDEISGVVSTNAASSEETAAMTVEISKNAEVLKSSMKQFNLRNRVPGKPYIPPEKSNDEDFIRIATDNYNKFLNSAEGRKFSAEMKTDKL